MPRLLLVALVACLAAPAAAQAASFDIDGTTATLTLAPNEAGSKFVIGASLRDGAPGLDVNIAQSQTDFPVSVQGCTPPLESTSTDPFCTTDSVITRWVVAAPPATTPSGWS